MFIEGTCVCGFGPLHYDRPDDDPAGTITHAVTGGVMVRCPTCDRRLDGDELLPVGDLSLVQDAHLQTFAALLDTIAPRVDDRTGDGARHLRAAWAAVVHEQARRARSAVDDDPREVLAHALADARRALAHAARPGDEGQDCPGALHVLVAAIMGPSR